MVLEGGCLVLNNCKEDSMGSTMGKMWRWVMCGTRNISPGPKRVILIPNDHSTSTYGSPSNLNATESQWIARTERQRLPR
jgi:hypothetical protein